MTLLFCSPINREAHSDLNPRRRIGELGLSSSEGLPAAESTTVLCKYLLNFLSTSQRSYGTVSSCMHEV